MICQDSTLTCRFGPEKSYLWLQSLRCKNFTHRTRLPKCANAHADVCPCEYRHKSAPEGREGRERESERERERERESVTQTDRQKDRQQPTSQPARHTDRPWTIIVSDGWHKYKSAYIRASAPASCLIYATIHAIMSLCGYTHTCIHDILTWHTLHCITLHMYIGHAHLRSRRTPFGFGAPD